VKKVPVSLPDEIVNMLDTELCGKLGEGRSDTLRTIIMNWLGEKGYLTKKGGLHE
jgi:metal-responsive CopG/Arc/MetJ family transcriptional regulator